MTADPNSLDLYDYDLPPERIAQEPPVRRDASRLLVLERSTGAMETGTFPDIAGHLGNGDLLVLNDVRVWPGRFRLARPTGGDAEVLLLESLEDTGEGIECWDAIVRPVRWGRRHLEAGRPIDLVPGGEEPACVAEVRSEIGEGRFVVAIRRGAEVLSRAAVLELCERHGEMPLPPYIQRGAGDRRAGLDRERYQTVYARTPLAAAAPTAGLHFTDEILERLEAGGVEIVRLTHQVGLGTFQPIRVDDLREHHLHAEETRITAGVAERLIAARAAGRRVVAAGTTTVRALESFALAGAPVPYTARTELFITPGHRFRMVNALLTNFHLPRSSLLVLVSSLAGRERILAAYRRAIEEGFRFYSYGDAMLIL